MLIRLFLLAFIVALIGRTVRNFLGGAQKSRPEATPTPLVADPVCGLYVDKDQALTAQSPSGDTVYFCSRKCRDTYLTSPPPPSSEVRPDERRSG